MDYNIEDYMVSKASEVMCMNCLHRWFSIRPVDVLLKDLECPKCHETNYVIETGEVIYEDI